MINERPHDLSKFEALNKEETQAKRDPKERKRIGERRMDMIRDEFPSTVRLDWKKAFNNDRDLFARIWRDMVKLGQTQPGRPGPRPTLEFPEGMQEFRRLAAEDYSTLPFPQAFRVLSRGLSFTMIARKVGLDRNLVYRLQIGTKQPDVYALKQVAKAFKKDPSYFMEYRTHYIASAMLERLENAPEASVNLYRQLQGQL